MRKRSLPFGQIGVKTALIGRRSLLRRSPVLIGLQPLGKDCMPSGLPNFIGCCMLFVSLCWTPRLALLGAAYFKHVHIVHCGLEKSVLGCHFRPRVLLSTSDATLVLGCCVGPRVLLWSSGVTLVFGCHFGVRVLLSSLGATFVLGCYFRPRVLLSFSGATLFVGC